MEAVASGLHVASSVREGIGDEFSVARRVTEWFGQRLSMRIAHVDRGASRFFHLPDSLRRAWMR